jgi:flavin-dependent dehydrogenase
LTPASFDALVIGGGPGGATAALLLARAGWSVGVIEKTAFPRGKVCGEFLSATNLPLLRHLGLAESFIEQAGPEVRQVGLFAGHRAVTSDMPRPRTGNGNNGSNDAKNDGWGRALGRDHLDTLLLDRAAAAGAAVWQPWSAVDLVNTGGGYLCRAVCRESGRSAELRSRIVIAAHGSWEPGTLPTQPARPVPRPSDLFGFKAHFLDSRLPAGLMPLLAFPGGYGGMVHTDHGRVSLSCCIRRDRLESTRRAAGSAKAGEAVLAHIKGSCHAAREALAGARREHDWLSAGPIRPGIRRCGFDGVFLVGNAAGEAHPVVAEGIGMAMQSAWLFCEHLTANPGKVFSAQALDAVRSNYTAAWRQTLAPRIRGASCIAHWAMSPAAVACALPLVSLFPAVLTLGARWSGKAASPGRPLPAQLL